ncbi:hypothetical protein ACHAO8_008738 [Botrytis cinerea]
MPLLDRLRNSLRTRVGHKRHALNECNIFEDMEEPSTEGVQETSLTLFKNSRLFKARASDDTSTISANLETTKSKSSVNLVIQQETALISDQCLSDSQQGNDRIRLDSVGNSSAEDLEIFGYPLQRVKARSSYSSSGWGMQDQINHHMGEDAEKSTPGSGNPHSEDLLATRDFATPNDLTSLFTLQGQLPYRKQKDEPTMTTRFRNLSSENPHRRVRVCNGIFFNQFSTNLNLKDNVQDGTMKGNIADEYL